jgi:type I restriction enzyme S subunit
MKTARPELPIMSSWMLLNGLRLDSGPYLSGGIEARAILTKLTAKKQSLQEVTRGGMDGIYNGPQFSRNYVNDPHYGVPFLGTSSMLQADLSNLPLLSRKDAESPKLRYLRVEEHMTLITCSGTVGRMAYVRPDMAGVWSNQDILKVVADENKILPGYLYAYLSSRFGVPLIVSGTYGAIIQHIEPRHIADLPVPRLGEEIERRVHELVVEAASLRSDYQAKVRQATDDVFESVGLRDITASEWHQQGRDLGYSHQLDSAYSLRSLNFNPRFQSIVENLSKGSHRLLGDICEGGKLQRGLRFSRIDCDPGMGIRLVGQRELFWLEPEGRWISPGRTPEDVFVADETIMVAALGTLGENEVFCRCELITGSWLQNAYSENLLTLQSGTAEVSGAYLFAFLRSESVFRSFRSMSIGSKQQVLHGSMLARLPVPLPSPSVRAKIETLVRDAYQARHTATDLEREAITIIERTIAEES